MRKVSRTKIRMQQVPRTKINQHATTSTNKISTQQVLWTELVSWGQKNQFISFTKRENQHATRFIEQKIKVKFHENKNKEQQVSRTKISVQKAPLTKNQHSTSSMNKVSFTRRKIKVQVSRRENSRCNNFHKHKSQCNWFHEQISATSSMNKISFTRRKINEQVLRTKNSACNKFHEQKINTQ